MMSALFFDDTATTEIYTLSLHDALPILLAVRGVLDQLRRFHIGNDERHVGRLQRRVRSEEHTSELQSLRHLVCRLLLEKKNRGFGLKSLTTQAFQPAQPSARDENAHSRR